MDICPANFICFDKHTLLLIIVGGIIIVTHHIGTTNDKLSAIERELRDSKDKLNTHRLTNLLNNSVNNSKEQESVYKNRTHNVLAPPERSRPHTPPPNEINIPTRGMSSGYQQTGVLIEENGTGNSQVKLPLYGQQLYPRSKEWNYYTNSDGYQSIKLNLTYHGRNSMDTYGAPELYDGNVVKIDGYDSNFKVTIYQLDTLRYIPNMT